MVPGICESGSHRRQKLAQLLGVPTVYFLAEGIVFPGVGFFLMDFIDGLGTNARSMGFVHSLYLGVIVLFGPIATSMAERFGNRTTIFIGSFMMTVGLMVTSQTTHIWQIFLSHSFVTGCGLCLLTQGIVYDLTSKFNTSASLYIGFMYAGSSVGFILNPLIFSQVRQFYGWRGTILLGSAISSHTLPLVLILFRQRSSSVRNIDNVTTEGQQVSRENDGNRKEDNEVFHFVDETYPMELKTRQDNEYSESIVRFSDDASDRQSHEGSESTVTDAAMKVNLQESNQARPTIFKLLKIPRFLMIATVYCFGRFAYIGFFVHLTASLLTSGFSEQEAALIFTAYGIGSLFGKSCCGLPGQIGVMSNYNFYMLTMFIIGFCFVIFSFITSIIVLFICGAVIGAFVGVFVGLFPAITQSCVSKEWFNFAYGYIGIPTGISSAMGGYIMGAVYDASGVYTTSFYIAGACFIFNGVLMLADISITKCHSKLESTPL